MKHQWFIPAFVLVLAFTSVPSAGEKDKEKANDNPYRTAKVGDFTSYKMSTKIGDFAVEGAMKMIVIEKDEKSAKLKIEVTVLGTNVPDQETTVDLTKPLDFAATINQGKKGGKFEQTGEGTAKIKVGGKEYDSTWITGKALGEAKGVKIDSEVKVWFSKEVPLNGMLKMETKAAIANVVLELTEYGNAK